MSRSLNKAILIGNLGADPEIRSTNSGTRVAQLSIATSRRWTDSQGEAQERTEWHRVSGWGKLADIAEQYLKKGDRVYIEGEIQYRSYEDKDGVTKYMTEINARELIMLGGREEEGSAPAPQPSKPAARGGKRSRTPAAAPVGGGAADDEFDDLPF